MKIKTSELTGAALDWAVAQIVLGVNAKYLFLTGNATSMLVMYHDPGDNRREYRFSTDWAQGGRIIDLLKGFQIKHWLESRPETRYEAHIHNYEGDWIAFGPTPLIAAMRCFVASKLGNEVDVPKELLK